ncbi:imelysin family protein [Roseovarius sp. M141]|uniref:imelysin family protein n=1 Tax=Roseovarius sp. M141 TaxID=2583806 RepID=UPI0020CBB047|nr:imelysin family protein [Roseovarius sp. M141]MCQ0094174.1 peptidase M75 [Roseovarius sp. M141]
MRLTAVCLALFLPAAAGAQSADDVVGRAVGDHMLPRYVALAETGGALAKAAQSDCAPDAPALRAAYHTAFDAWISVSHLRFGPSETGDRAFALAFWPDTRGLTPRSLHGLIADADPVADSADAYSDVSIAARGYYALEFMLYDAGTQALGDAAYRCQLVQVMAADIAALSQDILADWQGGYGDTMQNTGADSPYRTPDEAVQELFKALTYGLQFTADTRLGRPLGTFDAPHPKRAEAWRSGRPLRNVVLSLETLADLAAILAQRDPALAATLQDAFQVALSDAAALDDPLFAGVADPNGRLRVESLQQSIGHIREVVRDDLGPELGVVSGFNAMDGD